MKHIIVFLLVCTFATVHANEITYYNATWAEIKAKAKAEKKYIMVDCYTDWCGWCKVMDKKTMPDAGVQAMVNEKFVAVKMEMEHGEGIKLGMKYDITGYPTFMYFNPAGELVYVSVGYEEPKDFIKELNTALDKSKQYNTPGYSASIDIDFPEFYKMAFAENGKRKFPEMKEVTAYLDKQTDLFSEVNWDVLARFDAGEKYTQYFLDNFEKYNKLFGNYSVNEKVNSIISNRVQEAIKNNDKAKFSEVLKMVDKYVKNDAASTKLYLRMNFYKSTKDWDGFFDAFNEYLGQHEGDNAAFINENCWNLYENCDDQKSLMKACTYMAKAVAAAPEYAYMDTYAALLYKTRQMKYAETWACKAIDAGKQSGTDVASTEALLKKIKAAK